MPPSRSPLDDHFQKPRNAGVLDGADLHVQADNPVCGDTLHLYLKRGADGRVSACKFQVYGCPAAIAAGSLLTEILPGCLSSDLGNWTQDAISEALGGLGTDQVHAAVLASDAVAKAREAWNRIK